MATSGREYLVMVLAPLAMTLGQSRYDLNAAYRVFAPSPIAAQASISTPPPGCKTEVIMMGKALKSTDPLVQEAIKRVRA